MSESGTTAGGKVDGAQIHVLSFLGETWGKGARPAPDLDSPVSKLSPGAARLPASEGPLLGMCPSGVLD
jgi:hypothetical protein